MNRRLPPNPRQFRSLHEWATQFYDFLLTGSARNEKADPMPVLLSHRSVNSLERASVDGILLYDPVYETTVVSVGGKWEPLRTVPLFMLCYDELYNVDGNTITTGGMKVPYNEAEINNASWATFNPTTNDFTLIKGIYSISGFVTITKTAGGAKRLTGYLAKSSDLTTITGTVRMGTTHISASAPNDTTLVVPFTGQVTVDAEDTYAFVVQTSDSDTALGKAHDILGYDNEYSRLTICLIGLNE